jgi:hypothetical protein
MENDDYNNLVTLLKLFKNRPYHLAKYLVENSALNKKFIDKVLKSDKLNGLNDGDIKDNKIINFTSISQMENFYSSLIDIKNLESKTKEELAIELNQRLNDLIRNEKYEDAANLRDYMVRKGIKRNINF